MSIVWKERTVKVDDLKPYERNPRHISEAAFERLKASISEMGYHQRIIVQPDLRVVGGHQRIRALRELGIAEVPVLVPSETLPDDKFRKLLVTDNLPFGEFDFEVLLADFTTPELAEWGMPGEWLAEPTAPEPINAGRLAERFMVPPFSVMNAREGWWRTRKKAWLALGMQSELGRGEKLPTTTVCATDWMKRGADAGGSVFDPVLCELAYRWFCPPAGIVLDPFAGGSVRGIVAAHLGRPYHGIELRAEQVKANEAQAEELLKNLAPELRPTYTCADSREMDTVKPIAAGYDLLFTCPPYADLEVYSDDPRDISILEYPEFRAAYNQIIAKACERLKNDRFACVVVGEVRGKDGSYYDFVGDTVRAFRAAGLEYYNEAIVITPAGSLPIRAGKQFSTTRKLGKTHQNVLVFVKGDAKRATEACGEVEVAPELFETIAGN